MKEAKNVFISFGECSYRIDNVKTISGSLDGRMIMIVASDGTKYETAIQNVLIVTKEGDEK